jgi:hypothetical protein
MRIQSIAVAESITSRKDVHDLIASKMNSTNELPDEMLRLKFSNFRMYVQYHLLKNLFNLYEQCFQELLEIEHQVEILKLGF